MSIEQYQSFLCDNSYYNVCIVTFPQIDIYQEYNALK